MNEQTSSPQNTEELEKSAKNLAAMIGVAGSLALSQPAGGSRVDVPPPIPHHQEVVAHSKPNTYNPDHMLRTIASIESSGGKNTNHQPVNGAMHRGESAYGKYALMPQTIRETIKLNHDLKNKFKKAIMLRGDDMHRFMEDNPGLEDVIAKKHLKRLERHFGSDPIKIGYGWNQGITGTNKAIKEKLNIGEHPYAQKVKAFYAQKD